jgi:hypothetical protein
MTEDDKDFCRSVLYFWSEKGDPERYVGWSDEHCKALMPDFYKCWMDLKTSEMVLRAVGDKWKDRLDYE